MSDNTKKSRKTTMAYACSTALLPFIIMSYQYAQNYAYLSLLQVVIFCVLAAIFMLVLYFVSRFFIQSEFGAFIFTGVLFTSFFTYHHTQALIREMPMGVVSSIVQYTILFVVATAMAFRIKNTKRFKRRRLAVAGLKVNVAGGLFVPYLVMILIVLLFMALWLFVTGFFHILVTSPHGRFVFYCAFFLASAFGYLCRRFRKPLEASWLCVAMLVLPLSILIQSIIPIITLSTQQRAGYEFYKQEFHVDETIEWHPNVYWIHADGMLGFDAMYRFFDDEQEEFTRDLEDRGFWINRSAYFVSEGLTHIAIPTLMSPFYFDRVQSWLFDPAYAEYSPLNRDLLENPDLRLYAEWGDSGRGNRLAMQRNELVIAFETAGYDTSTISGVSIFFYPTVDRFYDYERRLTATRSLEDLIWHVEFISSFRELTNLLSMITPLPGYNEGTPFIRAVYRNLIRIAFEITELEQQADIFSGLYYVDSTDGEEFEKWNLQADSLIDIMQSDTPRFVLHSFEMAHGTFEFDEYGYHNDGERDSLVDPALYPSHHRFTAFTLLQYLDIIIENDPDAIIVIQADHGLQVRSIGRRMELDYTDDESLMLMNQGISAVRLPEELLTPETIEILSDPRNISRFLINNFVGENYYYIPAQFRQTSPD